MALTLTQTTWHDQPAWQLESPVFCIVTVPGMGAKIVSVYDKTVGHEWLIGPGNRPFKPAPYGSPFTQQDMSGWDEMFPAIDECRYPVEGPFKNALIPDHGEVWSISWDIEQAENGILRLGVNGRALPYRLTRMMQFTDDRTVRIDYTVMNTGHDEFIYLWAAHPQFIGGLGIELRLPGHVKQVMNIKDLPEWGKVGEIYPWPEATTKQGEPFRLDHHHALPVRQYRKFNTLADQVVTECNLTNAEAKSGLHFEWDVPYLGIWVDEGQPNEEKIIAPEPSNAFYDNLEIAWNYKLAPTLKPGETHHWMMTVQLMPR
jgi:galactose mutarotase-like enzyme